MKTVQEGEGGGWGQGGRQDGLDNVEEFVMFGQEGGSEGDGKEKGDDEGGD